MAAIINNKFSSVKIVFNEDIRRVQAPANFALLRQSVIDAFPVLANVAFTVKYLDEEQEMITVTSDYELQEGYQVASTMVNQKIPKFFVFSIVIDPASAAAAAASTPVSAPAPAAASPVVAPAPVVTAAPAVAPAPVAPASAAPAAATPAAPAVSATEASLPAVDELVALAQEFVGGAYTTQNHVLSEELPTAAQVLLSDATLANDATVQSVIETVLASSNVLRQHPVVQRLLPLLTHSKVAPRAEQALQRLKLAKAEGRLPALRERALAQIAKIPMYAMMLPMYSVMLPAMLPSLLARFDACASAEACAESAHACAAPAAQSSSSSSESSDSESDSSLEDELAELSISDLRARLRAHNVSSDDVIEKPELVQRLRTAMTDAHSAQSKPAEAVHNGITCDGCQMSPILGSRYKCVVCPDYDNCENCHTARVHGDHPLLLTAAPAAVHHGVSCDGCGMAPITGARFKCSKCPNYDNCEACERRGVHPSDHALIKINTAEANQFGWGSGRHRFNHRHGGHGGHPHHGGFFGRHGPHGHHGRHHGPHDPHGHGERHGERHARWWAHAHRPAAELAQFFRGFGRGGGCGRRSWWRQQFDTAPAAAGPSAQFVRDVTLPDRCAVPTSVSLLKTWLVTNTGTQPWPAGTKLIFFRGDRELTVEEEYPVASAAPGASVEVSAVLCTPAHGGRFSITFHLADAERNLFGPRLWADLLVEKNPAAEVQANEASAPLSSPVSESAAPAAAAAVEPGAELLPVASPVAAPAAPAAAAPVAQPEVAAELAQLQAMGFGISPEALQLLLQDHGNNVQAVVGQLLGA